ncbi:hypothetical protein [Hugenholtzia roseola]|uniref:hypothetical protein n=1 Tax=Hugenholtzia roseola TaxID=1002 RepID=UPI0003FBC337|nr:hypothetical protein [Hugenholtzia roseola]
MLIKKKTLENRKKSYFRIGLLLGFMILFSACEKLEEEVELEKSERTASQYAEGEADETLPLVLGRKLENPYTVENMKAAVAVLGRRGYTLLEAENLEESHYYIKFKPKNEEEYSALLANNDLTLYSYPLDYEVLERGSFYHDPTLPQDVPTYQYASVRKENKLEVTCEYEVLAKLYIPEEDERLLELNQAYVDMLLNQAYAQTGTGGGNGTPIEVDIDEPLVTPYRPGGRILIYDTRLQMNIGLQGAEIRANRWFTTYKATTDFAGNYRMSKTFNRRCNYSLHMEHQHFHIRKATVLGALVWINGPKQDADWNHTIASGYNRFAGHILRAAYMYHYRPIDGLQRPYRPFGTQTGYVAVDAKETWQGISSPVTNVVKIARYKNNESGNVEMLSDDVFGTTIHETAHVSHVIRMNAGVIQFSQVSTQIQESWALAVEWWLTKREYQARGVSNYGEWNYNHPLPTNMPREHGYQYWRLSFNDVSADYTTLFINLVDSHNELNREYTGRRFGFVNDQVSGYTLAGIEANILKHSYGLSSLSQKLKQHKPAGVTDAQIDLLLSFY